MVETGMDHLNQVLLGDCLGLLKQLPDNSVDLICTDPPYRSKSRAHLFQGWGVALRDLSRVYVLP